MSLRQLLDIDELLEALRLSGEPRPKYPGIVYRHRTMMDMKVCEVCAPLNGELHPFPPDLARWIMRNGPVFKERPPIHPNCRCRLEEEEWLSTPGFRRPRLEVRPEGPAFGPR